MTQTLDPGTTTGTSTGTTPSTADPQARVNAWLARFEAALAAGDATAGAELFATECYWRDLVAFTWNIKTVEGRDGVADLIGVAGARSGAAAFATSEPPDEADGVVTAWITFETGTGRGNGLLRLKEEDGEDHSGEAK